MHRKMLLLLLLAGCGEARHTPSLGVTFVTRESWPLAPGRYGALCTQCVAQLDKTVGVCVGQLICRVDQRGPLPEDATTFCNCEERK